MADVTYFQRYSGPENVVTNNTLQLFSRIYDHSPQAFQSLLNELCALGDRDPSFMVGPNIKQQVRSGSSVPDGSIDQQSFRLLIETKTSSGVNTDQLLRHLDGFDGEALRVLLLVVKTLPNEKKLREIGDAIRVRDAISGEDKNDTVVFNAIDFRSLCRAAKDLFQPYEQTIRTIVTDYEDYCRHEGILDDSHELMRIVPCGHSFELNRKYGIYYHPLDRGYTQHAYVGVYAGKAVRSLWRVRSVFDVNLDNDGNLDKELIEGEDTSCFDESIKRIIPEAESHCGHEIRQGHLFFCGKPFCTYFEKTSKYGIQKNRYCNLKDTLRTVDVDLESTDTEGIARALRDCKWQ